MGVKIAKSAKNVTGVKQIEAELEKKCINKHLPSIFQCLTLNILQCTK